MRRIGLVFSIVFAGGSAWADECPRSFELEDGLRLEYENGFAETFVKRDNGAVETTSFRPNGARYERRLAVGGIFETSHKEFDETGENPIYSVEYSYSFPLGDYIPSDIGKAIRGTQTETSDDGYTHTNRYKLEIGAERTIVIGGCQYNWIEVEYTYGFWWDHDKDWAMYLPELGVLLRVEFDVPYNMELIRSGKLLLGN